MRYLSRLTKLSAFILFASLLSACGGGDSSSGTPTPPSDQRFAGNQVIILTGNGANERQAAPFVMTISGNTVSITDTGNPAVTARGTLSGTSFTASGSDSILENGVRCNFNLTYRGNIANNTASGNISGNVPCTNGITSLTFNVSGSFTAN